MLSVQNLHRRQDVLLPRLRGQEGRVHMVGRGRDKWMTSYFSRSLRLDQ